MTRYPEKVICWDLDGVLCSSDVVAVAAWNKFLLEHGIDTSYSVNDLKTFRFIHEETLRLTDDRQLANEAERVWFTPEVMGEAGPDPIGICVVKTFAEMGANQVIVTTRPPGLYKITVDFVNKHLPFPPDADHLRIRRKWDPRSGDTFKKHECTFIHPLLFIEDNAATVSELLRAIDRRGLRTRVAFKTMPWNDQCNDPRIQSSRVEGWKEIFEIGRELLLR